MASNLPNFNNIDFAKLPRTLAELLDNNKKIIKNLLSQSQAFTWDNLIAPLEALDQNIHHLWSRVSHLKAVANTPELRTAYHDCIPLITAYYTELSHNLALYQAVQSITEGPTWQQMDYAQRKIISDQLRDFKLSGVTLSKDKKKEFSKLSEELSQLTTKFDENVLDATQGWHYLVSDEKQLAGLPDHAKKMAQQTAKKQKKSGWLFNLELPSYLSVIMYADSRELREKMYTAFVTRASDQGPKANSWDNQPVIQEILTKRLQLARLLDFDNYAAYSLSTKMVDSPTEVLNFLQELVGASLEKAKKELKELQEFARELDNLELKAWDVSYYSEKLRQQRYSISQEDLRPYFPEDQVINGLFAVVNKLFKISITEIFEFDAWHKDVRCFSLANDSGTPIAYVYFDLYARENKRGGAWMDDCQIHWRDLNGELQLPIAFVNCNFNAPSDTQPALFTHDDVICLFHEFGHALQHMLTKIDYAQASGINGIPWDAVEIASQLLENWAWEESVLTLIAKHHQTNEPLPEELFNRMIKAKNFQSAMQMIRQLEFSLFDFRLHMEFDPQLKNQTQKTLNEVRAQMELIAAPAFNRFQNSFSHIFAGGYAAGYYSYKWAEVMSSDIFSLFKEKGIFDPPTSQKFLVTFLESGGAIEPMDLFIDFRGRKPQTDALLKQSGIT